MINNLLQKKQKIYKNCLRLYVLFLLIAIILIPNIYSLGVTPGRTTINYEEGLEREVTFSILNNEHKNMQVFMTIQGELNNSITLSDNLIEFSSNETSKQFKYKIKLPSEIENIPGIHRADIIALEVPKAKEGGTYVSATVAVITQLYIYVACPGKCIESDLNVLDSEQNETATFIVPIVNRGKLGIGEVRAIIDIYNSINEKIGTIETDYRDVKSGERTELSGKWNVSVNSGNYLAKVGVFYDGESKNFEKQFAVGIRALSIESILVNNFRLGEIAKLQILVENKWTQELKNIFANLIVYNSDNQIMADIKSANEIIPPLAKKELTAYWDTVGVKEGVYNGKLMVWNGEKSSDKNLILKVSEDSLDVTGVGYAIRPNITKGINLTNILIIIVVLLIIINLSWFIYFYRFKKR